MPSSYVSTRTRTRAAAPFLKKLWKILQNEQPSIIEWMDDGRAFQVHDIPRFCSQVLNRYFRHGKYSSFTRQLNYFGFAKSACQTGVSFTYYHPHFQRDHFEMMQSIQRKTTPTVEVQVPKKQVHVHSPLPYVVAPTSFELLMDEPIGNYSFYFQNNILISNEVFERTDEQPYTVSITDPDQLQFLFSFTSN